MARRTRMKAPAIPAPRTKQEAEDLLGEIGRLQRMVVDVETQMNGELAAVKARAADVAAPLNQAIADQFAALHVWAETHRDELLLGKAKTAKLATGEISWRMSPPAVSVRGADKVIETLKRLGLGRFLRTKEEIDKQAILADPEGVDGVAGISVSQREEFVARPFASEIERVETVRRAG